MRTRIVFNRHPIVLLSIVFLLCAENAFSQETDAQRLAREIDSLKSRQAAIERRLEEITRTLERMQGVSGAPPTAPSAPAPAASIVLTIEGAPFKGARNAPVTLVEFSDYQCGFCARHVRETLPLLEQNYIRSGKVKYVFKNFPVEKHKLAFNAHQAAACAGDQGKYWEMHDALFANPAALAALPQQATALGLAMPVFRQCFDSAKYAQRIRSDVAEGRAAKLTGTPMFYLGLTQSERNLQVTQTISGAKPYAVFKQVLEALLARTAPTPP